MIAPAPAPAAAVARPARRPLRPTLDLLLVALAGAAFLALTLYQLQLPGLYYDEAWDAVTAMQIVHGITPELERGAHITLFGHAWPLMLDDYQGIVSAYLLVPFFLLGGVSVTMIRLFPILSGLLAVVLCYFLGRAWFGRGTGLIAAWLFALAPSWVFWSRLGVYVVSEVVPLTLGALLAFTAWWRAPRGRNGWLWLGSFLMGLGLATKLLYVWPIGAVAACYLLLYGRTLWDQRRLGLRALRPAWAAGGTQTGAALALLGAVVAFGIGAFTFLAYNWQTHGTWLKIRGSVLQTEYGTNNTTVLPNLWEEMDRFRVVLDGGYFWFQTPNALPYVEPLAPVAFVLAAAGLLVIAIAALPWRPDARPPRPRQIALGLAYLPAAGLAAAAFVRPNSRAAIAVGPGVLAVVLAAGAGAVLLRAALRRPETWARPAGGILLAATIAAVVTWLLTGAPDGQAQGVFDLRVTDLTGVLFWLGLIELLALLGWSAPATRLQRPLVATLGFLAAILAQSFPTLSGLWPTHLVVMLPLPQILIAGGLVRLATVRARVAAAPRRAAAATNAARPLLAGLAVLALAGSALWTDVRYQQGLAATGGLYAFSDGIYTLERYLAKAPDQPIVAAEWGIRRQLQILSDGQMAPAEIFQYGPNSDPAILAAFDAALEQTLQDPRTRYVFTAGDIGPYNRFAEFTRVLSTHGLVPFQEHVSYMRDGRPMYEVYTARPPAR